jgi:beta-1,4-N-acetylglucosaminyltransferase
MDSLLSWAINVTACIFAVTTALIWRFAKRTPSRKVPRRVMVVLGSGGHTSEMIGFLAQLPTAEWLSVRPVYIVSATDKDSAGFAERFEEPNRRAARIIVIPRAREVGQSYISSIGTTLKALRFSLNVVREEKPDVILCNGPGVCVPIVAAAYLLGVLNPLSNRKPTVAYFESFTCVDHLSLSGKILQYVVNIFTVSWPQLYQQMRKRRSVKSSLRYCGPFPLSNAEARSKPGDSESAGGLLKDFQQGKAPLAVVTVGSTCFNELIQQCDSTEFFNAIQKLGINEVLIQTGRTDYVFKTRTTEGMKITVCEYKPNLAAEIKKAQLLISHAGAGTILEAMRAHTQTIVVPNERLMSNHQLQLARALDEKGLLFFVRVTDLLSRLPTLAWSGLKQFPPLNTAAIQDSIRAVLA